MSNCAGAFGSGILSSFFRWTISRQDGKGTFWKIYLRVLNPISNWVVVEPMSHSSGFVFQHDRRLFITKHASVEFSHQNKRSARPTTIVIILQNWRSRKVVLFPSQTPIQPKAFSFSVKKSIPKISHSHESFVFTGLVFEKNPITMFDRGSIGVYFPWS